MINSVKTSTVWLSKELSSQELAIRLFEFRYKKPPRQLKLVNFFVAQKTANKSSLKEGL
jgi:hypothetical protein